MKSVVSKFLSVNTYDILKAAVVTFLYAFIDGIITYFNNSKGLPDIAQCKAIAVQSLIVLIAYIKVKALTNSDGKLFTKEPEVIPVAPAPDQEPIK